MCSCRRPSPTIALVLVLLWLYYTPCRTFSLAFNLNFSDPSAFSSIITAGDASISAPTLELTKNARQFPDIRNSVGQATFAHKVQLWSSSTGEMASFTTNFSFQITPAPGAYNIPFPYGDGMAFFLGHFPTAIPQNSSGRNLGLLTDFTAGIGDGRIVAVEFDTYSNPIYDDINGNHVGIDVNSLYSMASTDTTTSPGKNLSSSIVMEATVTYHNDTKMLAVDLLISDALYRVNATVDLSRILPEEVAVGFSAATGLSAAGLQQVLSWSFSSTLPDLPTSNSYKKRCSCRRPRAVQLPRAGCRDKQLRRGEEAGRGGFGGVYGGHLTLKHAADSRAVAVKMLSAESSAQGRREFEAEVRIISRLKHRNLVQLLGWCDSRKGLLLVYELVAESSLDKNLYSKDANYRDNRDYRKLTYLTWPQRYKIILGLGSALRYLHREWEQCIVHGDIKPSNIMLDSSLNTKLGDFGLARLVDHGTGLMQTTKAVLGTAGYIDPDFGVVLLEIVSGRPPVTETAGKTFSLLKWVWSMYNRDEILDVADPRLRGVQDDEWWMVRVLVVGLWCALPDRSERPSVAQAMNVLHSEEARLPQLSPYMYMAVRPDPASSAGHGNFSIDDPGPGPGCGFVRSSSSNTEDTILSPGSSSAASVRHSRFPTV
ncbi:hypothetical protein VPH35_125989 [Triticum aestivum]